MRSTQSSDAGTLKDLAVRLAPPPGVSFPPNLIVKTSRGFNSDETGRMLVPIALLQEYNENPSK